MLSLARYYTPLDMGAFGVLDVYGIEFYTVELYWRKNKKGISCIPEGTYAIQRCTYYGGDGPGGREDYTTYEILGVVGRSQIKFHIGNTPEDLQGCVGIGNALGVVGGRWAVLNSTEAHRSFMRAMGTRAEDTIRIYQARGET